jgi:hypothetical protein
VFPSWFPGPTDLCTTWNNEISTCERHEKAINPLNILTAEVCARPTSSNKSADTPSKTSGERRILHTDFDIVFGCNNEAAEFEHTNPFPPVTVVAAVLSVPVLSRE